MRIALSSLLILLASSTAFAGEAVFVNSGKPADVRTSGAAWNQTEHGLQGSGTGNVLLGGKRLGSGDFIVTMELTITNLAESAATIVLNQSHFGFEGRSGEMFTEGPLFGRQNLGTPVVTEGSKVKATVMRQNDQLTVGINGRTIVSTTVNSQTQVDVGLRPWRSTMLVTAFRASGNMVAAPEPPPHITVFKSGAGGAHTYRIPAIVVTRKGTLLAFCEGRRSGRGDAGDIDMLVSRSADNGQTWSDPVVVWDDEGNTCGNPAPVVDQSTGTIWLPMTWNLGSDHERDIMAGKSKFPRLVYMTHSTDDGLTWSKPIQISKTTRKDHWRWYATGPGNSIQLTRGPHKGRLVIPANHSDHLDESKHPYRSHIVYSDDHGKSWQLGAIHEDRTNESAVAELSDGSVLQAMRSYHGKGLRAMAVSHDGGGSFEDLYLDKALNTPVCQANILRYSFADDVGSGEKSRLLFCSPRGGGRSNLHVWMSYDEGRTWPVIRQIYEGGSAYSNLVRLPDGRIGVLYEKDGYKTISFVTFDLAWLEGK